MKAKSFLLLVSCFFCLVSLNGQIPLGFNYQAIARLTTGNPIINTTLPVRITIQADSLGTSIIWQELHSSVTTNGFGLMTLILGKGARQAASTVATFDAIDWNVTPKFIKTEIDYSGWKTMGVTRFWSVPYALKSKDSEQWVTSGANIYRPSGNVGIGTTTPMNNLDINGGITVRGAMLTGSPEVEINQETTGNRYAYMDFHGDDTYTDYALRLIRYNTGTDALSRLHHRGNGPLQLFAENSGPIDLYTSSTLRMRVASDGNIGIGTSTYSSKFAVQPSSTWADDIPLFEVRNKYGIPVFAVYNNGVRILVDHTTTKAVKGGFAVGGYDMTKAGKTVDFMTISPDSIRFNINNDNVKAVKGGFAVGGYDITKGSINQDFMYITPQLSNNGQYNTFLGYQAGLKNTGMYNVFLGYQAGLNKGGSKNYIIGYHAGYNGGSGNSNIFIGDSTGFSVGGSYNVIVGNQAGKTGSSSYNTYIGYQAGFQNSSVWNVIIGHRAGKGLTSTNNSVIIGSDAAWEGTGGSYNVIIGRSAGSKVAYSNNVFIGYKAGQLNATGQNNTLIGNNCGSSSSGSSNIFLGSSTGNSATGSSNIYIGNSVGYNSTASNELIINNGDAPSPLIFGNLSSRKLIIKGRETDNPNSRDFYVNGTAGGDYAWYNDSDERLKKEITTIPDALVKVLRLRGVNFFWKDAEEGMEAMQMGFIGQEAINVVPEVVSVKNDNYSMQYSPLTALLVEAIKEQQQIIESQNQKIDRLERLVEQLMAEK